MAANDGMAWIEEIPARCPHCGSTDSRVYRTRVDDRLKIRFRYRICEKGCGKRFVGRLKIEK